MHLQFLHNVSVLHRVKHIYTHIYIHTMCSRKITEMLRINDRSFLEEMIWLCTILQFQHCQCSYDDDRRAKILETAIIQLCCLIFCLPVTPVPSKLSYSCWANYTKKLLGFQRAEKDKSQCSSRPGKECEQLNDTSGSLLPPTVTGFHLSKEHKALLFWWFPISVLI